MEVALRPRINAPDVVRSALGQREKISENSIDKLFAAPSKIVIPERYIPEQVNREVKICLDNFFKLNFLLIILGTRIITGREKAATGKS